MLIGRSPDVDVVKALLDGSRGVAVITGPAGRGKTALLREAIGNDAVWVRGLSTLRDRSGATLSLALASVQGDLERDASRLLRHLDGRRLVIDDAHWADPYTLLVVELVSTAVRLAATWRTGDPAVPSDPPAHWTPYALGRLGPGDARALALRTRADLSESELQHVLDVADGSPLLIEELASGPSASPNLVSALLPRLEGLPDAVRFAVLLVAAAEAGVDEDHIAAGVAEPLGRSGLAVQAQGRWWSSHPLLQESVLELTDPSEVRRAHLALASLLAERNAAAAARHAARAGEPLRAIALAEAALARARGPLQRSRAAIGLADHLVEQRPELAWRLRVDASSGLRECGAYPEVIAAFDGQVFSRTDRERLGIAHCNIALALWELGDHDQSHEHGQQALAAVRGTESATEALARAGLAMYETRIRLDGAAALAEAREALRIAERRRVHITYARTRVAAALLVSGDPGWRAAIDDAVDDAIARGDQDDELLAREIRYLHAFVGGDLDVARADLHMVTDITREFGPPPKPRHAAVALLVDLLCLEDRACVLQRAERLLADEPIFRQRAIAVAVGAMAAIDLGRADIADRLLADQDPLDAEDRLVMAMARTELSWATGRALPARDDALDTLASHPAAVQTATTAMWHALEAGADLPAVPHVGLPGFAAAVEEGEALQALVREPGSAIGLFDDAAAGWWSGSDRRSALRCRWGAALAADRSGAPDGVERLHRCWKDATTLGSAPVATRAARRLRDHGVQPTPFPARPLPPLSGPETQVLRLVAAGFTTAEVATALGLHSSTVGDHLHAAIDRLHLRHRAEAVRWITGQP